MTHCLESSLPWVVILTIKAAPPKSTCKKDVKENSEEKRNNSTFNICGFVLTGTSLPFSQISED